MSAGSVTGKFIRTGVPITVSWKHGVITNVEPADEPAATEDIWLAPPLVDLQINGYAGVDFQQDDLTTEQLHAAVRALRRDGCTRCLYTLVTDRWPAMLARLKHVRSLVSADRELRSAIVGWHIEGPFLSPEPGYCGAHDPAKMLDPTPAHVDQLREAAGDDPILLTLAPERAGAIEAIRRACELGMKVCLGHTNATADQIKRAVEAGATGFTHLGNACPQTLDRHDNILWRALDTPGLSVSLIPDTHHVSPSLFRLIHRVLKPFQIVHTTDAMAAAGLPSNLPRAVTLGEMKLEVGADGIVRQPGKTNFAGSSLSPIEGVLRAAKMTGKPWQETWLASSLRPAEFMGWTSEIKVGQPVELCVLKMNDDGQLMNLETIAANAPTASVQLDANK
ncbi:N-acetylglucosamine-6-phosphate deacetylase [bacterium]|nr:N-acetylglucosamine-6-phosphate deacetylase [bacterium]